MSEKRINGRLVLKHDIQSNWEKATNFVPMIGEIIIYDIDENYNYERLKIGDGVQNVNALPFVDDALKTSLETEIDAVDTKVDNVSTLVGDTAVSEQISKAVADKANKIELPQIVTANSEDGVSFTATVPGVTELTNGFSLVIIPSTKSTSTTPTLNINGLGDKAIKRRQSGIYTSLQAGYTAGWLAANIPFRLMYDATTRSSSSNTGVWVVEGITKPAANDLYGIAPQAKSDGNGNIIVDTYATKTEFQNYIPKLTSITLAAANWVASDSIYYQDIILSCATATSMVNLQPTPTQLASWQDDGFAFTTYSADGSVSVYVAGGKPTEDYTVQVIVQEVLEV